MSAVRLHADICIRNLLLFPGVWVWINLAGDGSGSRHRSDRAHDDDLYRAHGKLCHVDAGAAIDSRESLCCVRTGTLLSTVGRSQPHCLTRPPPWDLMPLPGETRWRELVYALAWPYIVGTPSVYVLLCAPRTVSDQAIVCRYP